jgi:hypothetical protein
LIDSIGEQSFGFISLAFSHGGRRLRRFLASIRIIPQTELGTGDVNFPSLAVLAAAAGG